jgi:hypothetical protein
VEVVPVDLATTTVQAAWVATVVGTEVAVATGTGAGRRGRHGRNSEYQLINQSSWILLFLFASFFP